MKALDGRGGAIAGAELTGCSKFQARDDVATRRLPLFDIQVVPLPPRPALFETKIEGRRQLYTLRLYRADIMIDRVRG